MSVTWNSLDFVRHMTDIYLVKKLYLLWKVLNIQICQLEHPRNYVCYLELSGFQGTNKVFIVGKMTELSVESIDDRSLPVELPRNYVCYLELSGFRKTQNNYLFGGKNYTWGRRYLNILSCQLEHPRNYVCYLELSG